MSGSIAPGKQGAQVNKFTMEGKRSFDSYLAEHKAKKELKNNPGLQAELHGQAAVTPASSRKPKRKKSRVRDLDP
jgi:hypothetical protein